MEIIEVKNEKPQKITPNELYDMVEFASEVDSNGRDACCAMLALLPIIKRLQGFKDE